MEILFELFFEVILEFLLQVVAELLWELGLRGLAEVFRKRETHSPVLAFLGYALLGLLTGGLSLLIFPHRFIRRTTFHGISLVITPLLAGLAMSGVGMLRRRQGKSVMRLDSFSYGFIFAFGMALIRFLFAS
jgi:hypothetical protein